MTKWDILGIERTIDKKVIRKAYHQELRMTNPEEKQAEFIKLREAYEQAMEEADRSEEEDWEEDWEEEWTEDAEDSLNMEAVEYEEPKFRDLVLFKRETEKRQKIEEWWKRFNTVFAAPKARWDKERWYELLYEDIPYQMKYYNECRSRIYNILFVNSVWLPEEVWRLIDGFFQFSKTDAERVKENSSQLYKINKTVKLNELFVFEKFILESHTGDIDAFCRAYAALVELLPDMPENDEEKKKAEELFEKLAEYDVFYLPFESLHLSCHFDKCSDETVEQRMKELEERFGSEEDILLLKAEYALYRKDKKGAADMLHCLYESVSPKNFVMIYQMAECCVRAGLWYEGWMLYKMLTRLNPKPYMFRRAKEIYDNLISGERNDMQLLFNNTECDRLHLCKLHLEYDCVSGAEKLLQQVLPIKEDRAEYHMILCRFAFAVDDMEQAKKEYAILKNEVKDTRNALEQLEYRELQAEMLFEEKQYKEAMDSCNQLLEEYPLSYPAMLLRSYADWNALRFGKRYKDLNTLIAVNPEGVRARRLASCIMYVSGDYEQAVEALEPVKEQCYPQMEYLKAVRIKDSDYMEYHQRVRRILEESTKRELPIKAKEKHMMMDLSMIFDAYAMNNFGTQEKRKEIVHFCKILAESQYNHPEQYIEWFWVYYGVGMYDKAIAVGEMNIEKEKDPEQIKDLYLGLFKAYYKGGYYQKALDIFPHIEKDQKYSLPAMKLVGDVYEWAGMYDKAEQCFIRSVKHYGDHDSYEALEWYYYRRNQWDKLTELAKEEIQVMGEDDSVYINLFNLCIEMGKYDEALEYAHLMQQYTESDYVKKQHHLSLGNVYEGKREYAKALEHYEQAEREGCSVPMWDSMGVCNMALGNYEEALYLFEKQAYKNEKADILYLCLMQHCIFLMEGKTNLKLAEQIQEETEKQMHLLPDSMRRYDCYLGEAMAAMGQYAEAEAYFRQAESESACPNCGHCYEILRGKAWLCVYQGKYREAIGYLEQAIEQQKSQQSIYVEYLALKERETI